MTDRSHKLSLVRQADLLGISRGGLHCEPRPVDEDDLKLMRRIDELQMEYPFAGSRMMRGLLHQEVFTARAAARYHLYEADGDLGAISQAEHVETGARL